MTPLRVFFLLDALFVEESPQLAWPCLGTLGMSGEI